MTAAISDHGLRRTTGGLFAAGALAFAGGAGGGTLHIRHYNHRRQSDFSVQRPTS
jgi:hypothetical protein